MDSNWNVVHTAGTPWNGPGPFEQYVAAVEAHSPRVPRPFCLRHQSASPLVYPADSVTFYPAPPPIEAIVRVKAFLGMSMRNKREVTGNGDDTLMRAAVGRAISNGPKLFRPTARECEPLEQVDVGLTAADITLPFQVCVVEFPPDYAANRLLPSPTDAEMIRPGFVVVLQENGVLTVNVVLPEVRGGGVFDFLYMPVCESTVEAVLERAQGQKAVFTPFIRVALNFLMLAAGGYRLVGPANPSQAKTLRKRIKQAKKERKKDKYEELRTRLWRLPNVFTLAQEVKLFDREQPAADPNPDADGTPKTPHWRKGHRRRVPFGPGKTERKPTFIGPVLVNGHLLPG